MNDPDELWRLKYLRYTKALSVSWRACRLLSGGVYVLSFSLAWNT